MPASNKITKKVINIDSCLEVIDRENLQQAIEVCNSIIENFPNNPEALSDRSLIYTLQGKTNSACKDIKNALNLINKENVIGYKFKGKRFDCGNVMGALEAQISIAMNHSKYKDQVKEIMNKNLNKD